MTGRLNVENTFPDGSRGMDRLSYFAAGSIALMATLLVGASLVCSRMAERIPAHPSPTPAVTSVATPTAELK